MISHMHAHMHTHTVRRGWVFSIIVLPVLKTPCSGLLTKAEQRLFWRSVRSCVIDPGQVSGRLSGGLDFEEQKAMEKAEDFRLCAV